MYRTMEMRVEPKLSYAERLIISGSKRKVWFGYSLFAASSVFTWLKQNLIPGVLKLLCFSGLVVLVTSAAFGLIFLLTLIPGKVVGWTFVVALSGFLIYIVQMVIRIVIRETIDDLNEKVISLREATLKKLGPVPPVGCELYGSSTDINLQDLRKQIEELQLRIEEQQESILENLRELEHV